MDLKLLPLEAEDIKQTSRPHFKKVLKTNSEKRKKQFFLKRIIDQSLDSKGAAAYKAVLDGETVGGAIVVIDEKTQHNHLDLLYVKYGIQGKGIGKKIWFMLEKLYPDTKVWETCTPYFKKRNIHFYVNVCGFYIVEFFNEKHPMPDTPDDFIGDGNEGMFAFRKQM